MPSLTGKTGEFRTPLKIVAFWTDTVRTSPGQPAMRGFGGRLMFYENSDGKPVKVAGSLAIYAFDEANRDADNPKPDRKFVFTAEQFHQHYSKSELGHSYSFWIPWDLLGGETKQISLICRFTPVQGGAVVSDQVRQLLPGVESAEQKAATHAAEVKISHRQEPFSQPSRPSVQTATIELTGPPELRMPKAIARPRPPLTEVTTSAAEENSGKPIAAAPETLAAQPPAAVPASAQTPVASGGALVTYGKAQPRDSSLLARFRPRNGDHSAARLAGPWHPTHVARPINTQPVAAASPASQPAGELPPAN